MVLAIPLLLLAAAARQEPPVETFEMEVDGATIGTEEVKRVEDGDGIALSGRVALEIAGLGEVVLKQEARLRPDGRPLTYTLDVDAPGQQVTLAAKGAEAGYAMSLTPKGAPGPAQSLTVAIKAPVFLLDNNFASHLDTLTRTLTTLGPGEERTMTALVPQVLQAIPATAKRGGDGKGTLDGAAVSTRSYRLVIANLGTELVARAGDGALLQAEVPLQRAILRRRGFEAAATAGASAGPKGTAASLPDSHPGETSIEIAGTAGPLPATLLVPKSETSVPAVVFLSGSGPNDRDETIGPNKPFADIARGLGDRGIASLRFDKRTFAIKDKSRFETVRLADEYYEDAKVAIARLRATAGVDPKRIFVVGHSEGAMVAPKVAAASPETRGIVMMAPGVRPIDAIIIDQMERGARQMGRSDEDVAEQTAVLKATFAGIRDPQRIDTPAFMGAPAAYWRELIALDVPALVKTSKHRVLVVQGDEDIQTRKDADFELLRTRVGDAGGRVTYRSFAGLNHLFMKVEHASTGAEYGFPGHVEPAVIGAIADWILLH